MRKVTVTLVTFAFLVPAVPATAHHRPTSYCSASTDICQSVRKSDGVRKLTIVLSSKLFKRYVICVKGPRPASLCETFRIKSWDDGSFGSAVNFKHHFGGLGKGRYTVTWYRGPTQGPATEQIGRRLGFHY